MWKLTCGRVAGPRALAVLAAALERRYDVRVESELVAAGPGELPVYRVGVAARDLSMSRRAEILAFAEGLVDGLARAGVAPHAPCPPREWNRVFAG
jgi:hypothetical protein